MRSGILLVAKAPIAGQAKTRLAATVGAGSAADLAAAALLDTMDTCEEAFPPGHRVLAVSGDLSQGARARALMQRRDHWQVITQRGTGLGERLAHAHRDAARLIGGAVVQIGMDTPQVTAGHLRACTDALSAQGCDAVLGPADDGGWWALGVTSPRWTTRLSDVPMSTSGTAAATAAALRACGARVTGSSSLCDVDTATDAAIVAAAAPNSRFAQAWRDRSTHLATPTEIFDAALRGGTCVVHGLERGPKRLPVRRWQSGCDEVDRALLSGCDGPTLDVGCGPGRLTHELALRGVVALGIDIAPGAVREARARGAQALRRDVFEPLPAEGRWESVLLADGNIGIGGDPVRLLRRVRALLTSHGRAVVEVAPPGAGLASHDVHLELDGRLSSSFPWAVVGADHLNRLARSAALEMLWLTSREGRWFAQLSPCRAGQ